jgi:hypothetical protein
MAPNIPETTYIACFTEDDGVYSCGHEHTSIAEAMNCLVPDGGSFIRACEAGVFRSLNDEEFFQFELWLREMPWSSQNEA